MDVTVATVGGQSVSLGAQNSGKAAKTIHVADHFCGAGGTSTGIAEACLELGLPVDLLAINHWRIAIATHTAAHPWARHICQELQMVKPREAVPGGRLHLLAASPECTNHSRAKGGRPKDEQSRATGWDVLKWLQELYVDNVMLENVREWRDWGPLGADLKPLKSRKGETYRAFIAAAMTFPAAYPFAGNKSDQTKQIGNAVPPIMGEVLAYELLKDYVKREVCA